MSAASTLQHRCEVVGALVVWQHADGTITVDPCDRFTKSWEDLAGIFDACARADGEVTA